MGKKKDCFVSETYDCMTPNCPYAAECIKVVWGKKLERVLAGKNKPTRPRLKRSRLTVNG